MNNSQLEYFRELAEGLSKSKESNKKTGEVKVLDLANNECTLPVETSLFGKESENVVPGRWVFYCSDNPKCKQVDREKTYDNEIAPALSDGQCDDYSMFDDFI